MSTATALSDLTTAFAGRLLQPGEAGYDEARRVHNGLIDRSPALIAQCRGLADIVDAVSYGRASGLTIAVRGGGHNVAGRATVEGGIMIDLSSMRGVRVDAGQRLAWAEGGCLWRDFNRETQLYGLATTGGVVGSTGVAGLTLGGGLGWLMPKYGMTLDNLVAVDLVLADGRVVRASADAHPDLFWAVRGGGGNFGIAGAFAFRLHEVGPLVVGGLIAWPFDRARDVLRFCRDMTQSLPDEMFLVGGLITAPDGATKLAAIGAAHCGARADGEAAMAAIRAFGAPAMDALGPIPYTALNGMLDPAFPRGALNYWKSHFLPELTDAAIDVLVDRFDQCASPMDQIFLEHFHGAPTRVPLADTAFAMRSEGFNTLLLSQWTDPARSEACIQWTRDSYAALQRFGGSRRYLNYLADDDMGEAGLASAYGPNLPRLRAIKRRYDPDNVFRLNLNIPPA